ncbi:nitrite reductase small subunit NirD [Algibacter amylolyticus]|uniref:Nitrite reductase small subunit NirD n=1 Tax=Algibacter amylolyticus TaxID=1608400 RepID=A0A5M7AYQ7_9FLAO|nr:nitrite reductase small subunit NirD [Algibacter amylolyticus]KAA5822349.1 nitrite reductase small subunit NirD [Algibacter amylolyticus]MBB5269067.1 nitrite reductase (NADH) small subunit [Algibacter amylolyticus]TSJ73499.1 nitrite reductase small subunit NirD [Algibacter amylolyticus]
MNTIASKYKTVKNDEVKIWFKAAHINDFPKDGGACVKYKDLQIAVFNFSRLSTWYACQNLSPYKEEMVLSRGMIGDHKGIPMVACPLHKKTFSLETGENLNGELEPIAIYPVKIEEENVYIGFSE